MSLHLVAVGTLAEIRRVPADFARVNVATIFDLEVVADAAHATAPLACDQAGWLHVSTNGGSSYTPVPTDVQAGVDLGSFTAGQRRAIKLKLLIPAATQVRQRSIGLLLGEGT